MIKRQSVVMTTLGSASSAQASGTPQEGADQQTGAGAAPAIHSGAWRHEPGVADYAEGIIDGILIERVIWGGQAVPKASGSTQTAGPGYTWYRFWLAQDDQIVERYYDGDGQLVGTQVDLCLPLEITEVAWSTRDLLLDLWISPDWRVTVRGEAVFEEAIRRGQITALQATWAEEHLRQLTRAIAQRRFPPPMVRNWQVDLRSIHEVLAR